MKAEIKSDKIPKSFFLFNLITYIKIKKIDQFIILLVLFNEIIN